MHRSLLFISVERPGESFVPRLAEIDLRTINAAKDLRSSTTVDEILRAVLVSTYYKPISLIVTLNHHNPPKSSLLTIRKKTPQPQCQAKKTGLAATRTRGLSHVYLGTLSENHTTRPQDHFNYHCHVMF